MKEVTADAVTLVSYPRNIFLEMQFSSIQGPIYKRTEEKYSVFNRLKFVYLLSATHVKQYSHHSKMMTTQTYNWAKTVEISCST